MKKTLLVVSVNFLLFLVILFSSELLVRLVYPEIQFPGTDATLVEDSVYYSTPGLSPNSKGSSNGILKTVDQESFWKYEHENSDSADQVLFIGDSVTMGIGIDSDSTFSGIINNKIQGIKVLNPSLIGYSSNDYLNIIKKFFSNDIKEAEASSVFIFWCLNDVYSNLDPAVSLGFESTGFIDQVFIFFRNNFKLYHFLKKLALDRPKSYFLFDQQFYGIENESFLASMDDLISIKSILSKRELEFTVVLLPYEYQLRVDDLNVKKPQETVTRFLEMNEINVFDLTSDLKTNDPSKLYLYGDGIHFSNEGHKIIADILTDTFFQY